MSDTEEEASFASADEGDGIKPREESSKSAKQPKEKENVGKPSSGGKESSAAAQSKKEVQKGSGKQQQKQSKPKGNSDDKPAVQKEVKTKANPPSEKSAKETKTPPGVKPSEASAPSQEKPKPDVKQKDIRKEDNASTVKKPEKTAREIAKSPNANKKDGDTDDPSKSASKIQKTEISHGAHLGDEAKPDIAQDKSLATPKDQQSGGAEDGDVKTKSQQDFSSPSGQAIPRDHRDHTPEQEEVLNKLGESIEKSSGGGWRNWGSSLLSAATNSVQTFTHQVGDGFSTIMETVESSLGVPDPENILKAQEVTEPTPLPEEQITVTSQPDQHKQEEKDKRSEAESSAKSKIEVSEDEVVDEKSEEEEGRKEEEKKELAGGDSWFSGWSMSDIAKKVQDTGKSLASKGQSLMSDGFDAVENLAAGGIDVLESIGKKTYNTLSEHDPAFRKTREFLSPKGNKPNLSSVLKEAKEKAEYEADQARENEEARKAHFGTLFDNFQGIAHLEALEMLSNQSEKKVHSLLNALASSDLANIKPTLISIKEAFEVSEEDNDTPSEQDFSSLVSQYVSELELGTAPDKLNKVHEMVKQWIVDFDTHESHESDSIKEVHQKSIQALAELTAKGVEQFHKAGELVLFERDKDKDCTERARSLARLTGVLCHEVGNLAAKFAEILNKMAVKGQHTDEVTPLVTNVYLEATNSSTYIQDAFQLLLPVLQHAALEHSILSRQS